MVPVAHHTFDDQHALYSGSVFPSFALEGCETALCLFSAAWLGKQDAYWVAKAGLVGTCVDLDGGRLAEMDDIYPDDWLFVHADVFEFAANWDGFHHWDVVTLDPFTNLFERCADMLPTWCGLARKTVILGHGNYRLTEPTAPEGWALTRRIKRSDFKGGVYWLVYQREAETE